MQVVLWPKRFTSSISSENSRRCGEITLYQRKITRTRVIRWLSFISSEISPREGKIFDDSIARRRLISRLSPLECLANSECIMLNGKTDHATTYWSFTYSVYLWELGLIDPGAIPIRATLGKRYGEGLHCSRDVNRPFLIVGVVVDTFQHVTIMHPSVMLLSALAAFVAAESILMTEVFVIPIRPETFDWSADGKRHTIQFRFTCPTCLKLSETSGIMSNVINDLWHPRGFKKERANEERKGRKRTRCRIPFIMRDTVW